MPLLTACCLRGSHLIWVNLPRPLPEICPRTLILLLTSIHLQWTFQGTWHPFKKKSTCQTCLLLKEAPVGLMWKNLNHLPQRELHGLMWKNQCLPQRELHSHTHHTHHLMMPLRTSHLGLSALEVVHEFTLLNLHRGKEHESQRASAMP